MLGQESKEADIQQLNVEHKVDNKYLEHSTFKKHIIPLHSVLSDENQDLKLKAKCVIEAMDRLLQDFPQENGDITSSHDSFESTLGKRRDHCNSVITNKIEDTQTVIGAQKHIAESFIKLQEKITEVEQHLQIEIAPSSENNVSIFSEIQQLIEISLKNSAKYRSIAQQLQSLELELHSNFGLWGSILSSVSQIKMGLSLNLQSLQGIKDSPKEFAKDFLCGIKFHIPIFSESHMLQKNNLLQKINQCRLELEIQEEKIKRESTEMVISLLTMLNKIESFRQTDKLLLSMYYKNRDMPSSLHSVRLSHQLGGHLDDTRRKTNAAQQELNKKMICLMALSDTDSFEVLSEKISGLKSNTIGVLIKDLVLQHLPDVISWAERYSETSLGDHQYTTDLYKHLKSGLKDHFHAQRQNIEILKFSETSTCSPFSLISVDVSADAGQFISGCKTSKKQEQRNAIAGMSMPQRIIAGLLGTLQLHLGLHSGNIIRLWQERKSRHIETSIEEIKLDELINETARLMLEFFLDLVADSRECFYSLSLLETKLQAFLIAQQRFSIGKDSLLSLEDARISLITQLEEAKTRASSYARDVLSLQCALSQIL